MNDSGKPMVSGIHHSWAYLLFRKLTVRDILTDWYLCVSLCVTVFVLFYWCRKFLNILVQNRKEKDFSEM